MNNQTTPRDARILWQALPLACVLLFAGCQSYQPLPLDLAEHQASVATRLAEDESLRAFADRLSAGDTDTDGSFDISDGISSAEAEVIALFYNPDLRLARLRAGVALADAENAGLWEDPVFGFDGAELLSPSGPFEYGLTASLTIPISGRLGVEEDKADAAYLAELRRVVDAEWSMRSKVREAWATWSVANERLRLIDEVAEAIDRIIKVSDRLEEAGELTRVEARLLRAQRLAIRVQRLAIAADANQTRLDLMRLMGLLPSSEVTLMPALPAVDLPETSEATTRLITTNTSLAALRAEYQVAEESLRLEVRKQYPDIEIGAGLGSEDNDDRLLLGASLPLPILNANRGGIAEARANRELARAAAETEYERLAFQLASTLSRLKAAEQQRQLLAKEMVPMLDEQAAEINRLAELGEVDTLILLETVTRQFEAKNQMLDLQLTSLRDRIEVARLLGPDESTPPAPIGPAVHANPEEEASR
ncbi:MAG: TolC family protein [Phycisphaeraceae bacterium]|nr:TolC family protein [Phycisphaeraceae bacterium]